MAKKNPWSGKEDEPNQGKEEKWKSTSILIVL